MKRYSFISFFVGIILSILSVGCTKDVPAISRVATATSKSVSPVAMAPKPLGPIDTTIVKKKP